MAHRLAGKIAFVTGAAQGMGRATVEAFLDEGAQVIATDINAQPLSELDDRPSCRTHRLDVTNSAQVAELAATIGPIDILFNCAGYVAHGSILDCDEASWMASFDLNVNSMYRTIRAFLPGMLDKGSGSIINMASVASSVKGAPARCAYGSSKAAVIGLTKSVAADFVARGIRCNAVCPATVDSPSLTERIAAMAKANNTTVEQARQFFTARQPIGRIAKPQEITALLVYLASDESCFMTGTTQLIDGGVTI